MNCSFVKRFISVCPGSELEIQMVDAFLLKSDIWRSKLWYLVKIRRLLFPWCLREFHALYPPFALYLIIIKISIERKFTINYFRKYCLMLSVSLIPKVIRFQFLFQFFINCNKFNYFLNLEQGWPTQIGLRAATWKICQKCWIFGPNNNKKLRKYAQNIKK
jgi:hypothetical protein